MMNYITASTLFPVLIEFCLHHYYNTLTGEDKWNFFDNWLPVLLCSPRSNRNWVSIDFSNGSSTETEPLKSKQSPHMEGIWIACMVVIENSVTWVACQFHMLGLVQTIHWNSEVRKYVIKTLKTATYSLWNRPRRRAFSRLCFRPLWLCRRGRSLRLPFGPLWFWWFFITDTLGYELIA